jgi:three-Cys-motif partner protein
MPKVDNVGFGKFTATKLEILRRIVGMHLAVTQAVLNNRPSYKQLYKLIDATAGKGYVPGSTLPGSPLVFLNAIHEEKFFKLYEINLIEQNKNNFNELQDNVAEYCAKRGWDDERLIKYHLGRYEKILPKILGQTNNRELGLVFIDHSGDLPNFDMIKTVSELRPRMEILLYLSGRNIKRLHHITNKSLLDYMQEISKEYWLIRKPEKFDNLEWTFLLGSNTDIFKNYKKIDFFRLDSDEAQKFFPKLNLTSKERMAKLQPRLFDD